MEKFNCIIKRVGEKHGHMENIALNMVTAQEIVGGWFDVIPTPIKNLTVICRDNNDSDNLPKNFYMTGTSLLEMIRGDVIIFGMDENKVVDVPITLDEWKIVLKAWGNNYNDD